MATCVFFGHRDCSDTIRPTLRATIESLVTDHNVDMFYVGNQGQFDTMVRSELKSLQIAYPHIRYAVVLAYMPGQSTEYDDYSDTMLPEGLESIHPRYAISWRNDWMLKQSDYVIAYITHNWGGAAKYYQKAVKAGKMVINLHDS